MFIINRFNQLICLLPFPVKHFIRMFYIKYAPKSILLGLHEKITSNSYFSKVIPGPGDVFIDAGSYHGIYSFIASRLVGKKGRVIAFEPVTESFNFINKEVQRWKFKNITILNIGLFDRDGFLDVILDGDRQAFFEEGHHEHTGEERIAVNTLDNVVEELKLEKVNFIKMNIEGAEIEAIRGARKTVQKYNPKWAIWANHIRDGKQTCFEVERIFEEYGCKTRTENPERSIVYVG